MSDYIKREDAIFIALQQPIYSVVTQIKQLDGIDLDDYVPRDYYERVVEELCRKHTEEIASMPTIVRCKECKHWQNNHLCKKWSIYGTIETLEDGYCYVGDRKE